MSLLCPQCWGRDGARHDPLNPVFAEQRFDSVWPVPSLSDEAKYQVIATRAADKVNKLFGGRGCFSTYTDEHTIVIGSIDVPTRMATSNFINHFSARDGKPFLCLVDVVIGQIGLSNFKFSFTMCRLPTGRRRSLAAWVKTCI